MPKEIIVKGNPTIPNIALTFDDGPGRVTPYILDMLRKYGVKAILTHELNYTPVLYLRIAAIPPKAIIS
jgi:peptidoglycan/xylan/chitin deacetylase (PgdA/CDA1 family)